MSKSDFPSVSLCFPVYNEEESVGDVLTEIHLLLSDSGIEYEIVVCDDGSVDGTGPLIDKLASRYSNLKVLHNSRNLGIHSTFERLYLEATKDFVFLNSADRQWKTAILLEMLPLTERWDIIVARRKKKPYGLIRRFVSWIFNIIPFLLFGVNTFDAGAVKLMKREIIKRFTLVSQSPFSEAERLIRASRAGYRITEYPVDVSPRQTGRARGVNPKLVLDSCIDVFRVWWSIYALKLDKNK